MDRFRTLRVYVIARRRARAWLSGALIAIGAMVTAEEEA
jgi:hypothetical protein